MENNNSSSTPHTLKVIFGIFMILIYLGMGVLFMLNFFSWSSNLTWVRWAIGILLVIYGFWRAYRQVKDID